MKILFRKQRALILLLLLSLFIMPTSVLAEQASPSDEASVYQLLKDYHIHADLLKKGTIEEMINSIDDPYTQYFTSDEFQAFMNSIDGTLVGIGIYVEEKDGYIRVVAPVKSSPAEAAGLKSGDAIIKVNGESTAGKSINDVTSLIRGEEGTTVTLTILRENQELDFTMTRSKIDLPMVDYEFDQESGIGYIQIYTFGDRTFSLTQEALTKLNEAGAKGLILDLRGNPGGRLDAVIQVASLFIDKGPIMWVRDNDGVEESYEAIGGKIWDKPIALLIDKGSASASEILSSALKDYHLATVIGTDSFGKGTVQTMFSLPSGNVLKVTIDEYFSALKNKINKIGVKPDIFNSVSDEQLTLAIEWLKGIKHLGFEANGDMQLNDQTITSYDSFALHPNGWYISLYRLQLIFGGELSWDGKSHTATYSSQGVKKNYTLNKDDLLVKDQRIYVSIESLQSLPHIHISTDPNGNWTIDSSK